MAWQHCRGNPLHIEWTSSSFPLLPPLERMHNSVWSCLGGACSRGPAAAGGGGGAGVVGGPGGGGRRSASFSSCQAGGGGGTGGGGSRKAGIGSFSSCQAIRTGEWPGIDSWRSLIGALCGWGVGRSLVDDLDDRLLPCKKKNEMQAACKLSSTRWNLRVSLM
jgi:hypothetical protein